MDILKFTILAAALGIPLMMMNIASSYSKISANSVFDEVEKDQAQAVMELAKADLSEGMHVEVASK